MGTTKRERQKAGRQLRLEAARVAQAKAKRWRTARNLVIVFVVIVGAAFILSRAVGDDDGDDAASATTTTAPGETTTTAAPGETIVGETPCPEVDGSSPRTTGFAGPPPNCLDAGREYTARFDTSEGSVTVELDPSLTPGTVNNFVVLARYHYYDGTELFRTDPSIGIIQGGAPTTNSPSDPGPGYTIPDEGGTFTFDDPAFPNGKGPFTYAAGDLVMARSGGPNASGAQFFFGVNDAVQNLDAAGTYLKFGRVTAGLEVLEAILALHEDDPASGFGGPSRTITLNTVTIQEQPTA